MDADGHGQITISEFERTLCVFFCLGFAGFWEVFFSLPKFDFFLWVPFFWWSGVPSEFLQHFFGVGVEDSALPLKE